MLGIVFATMLPVVFMAMIAIGLTSNSSVAVMAVLMFGTLLWILGCLAYRVLETPAAPPPFDVAAFAATYPKADKNKARDFDLTGWSDDPLSLAQGNADVVVELIGGEEGIARQQLKADLARFYERATAR